ncbi:FAD-dependent oxidoreductase [Xenorhabdus sp. KJ12.1]|uniref:FAD-dependent oxidoreductase n=1 Tax=Xenorhabdus sp. KJ12.1 TaxID=1851571 RepID=UPI000C03CE9E|nr:FAD-dependent oxidoreductase [Xenorhabdus sp. KJ12.1]PHM67145.1 hypothetical protein Xekj_03943 [Xenorhabdus sp. KJ12.1]
MKHGKIAVIGGGGAGTVAAWLLNRCHDITLFEANDYLGGHAYSHPVTTNQGIRHIDMGVEYFNERLSPNLCALLAELDISSYVAPLSMQVDFKDGGHFWNNLLDGGGINIELRTEFDRFHSDMANVLSSGKTRYKKMSIGEFLNERGYSESFREQALLPMMTVYSGCNAPSLDYTLMYVAISFNMNLLSFFSPGYWRKAKGGINGYIAKIREQLGERVKLNTPVTRVTPVEDGVIIEFGEQKQKFEQVVFATHADITLSLLETDEKIYRKILGDFEYVPVKSYCHHDSRWMSKRSNNCYCQFIMPASDPSNVPNPKFGSLTRVNNILPHYHDVEQPLLVSFDPKSDISADLISDIKTWKLPKLRPIDFYRKTRIREIQGKNNIWFCGMDIGLTGHEGAIVSAMVIADRIGEAYPWKDNTLALIQFKVIKEIMGVYHPRERFASWIGNAGFQIAKALSLHKEQSHRFIKDLIV